MIDALGTPQSLLLLGGTSEIGLAAVRALAGDRLRRVVLAGRPSARLDAAVEASGAAAATRSVAVEFDAAGRRARRGDPAFAGGDVDVVVMAIGLLGDQVRAERTPTSPWASRTTYIAAMSAMLLAGGGPACPGTRRAGGALLRRRGAPAAGELRLRVGQGRAQSALAPGSVPRSRARGLVVMVRPGFVGQDDGACPGPVHDGAGRGGDRGPRPPCATVPRWCGSRRCCAW